jgi:TolB-like protein
MARCTNERFEKMLHLYELGLLSPDDLEAFELHLYECEYCFESVQQFREEALLIKHDPDVRKTVDSIVDKQTEMAGKSADDQSREVPTGRLKRILTPSIIIAAAALLVLILKPWHIEIQPTKEAIAAQNRLAIIRFDNLADSDDQDKLSEIATNLLITDLSESQYVQVISDRRISDVLNLLETENITLADQSLAHQVAEKADAIWMLTGKILMTDPHVVITTQLSEVSSTVSRNKKRPFSSRGGTDGTGSANSRCYHALCRGLSVLSRRDEQLLQILLCGGHSRLREGFRIRFHFCLSVLRIGGPERQTSY